MFRTHGSFTTCMGMFGSGVRTSLVIIHPGVLPTLPDLCLAHAVCIVVAAGSTTLCFAVRGVEATVPPDYRFNYLGFRLARNN